MVPLQGISFVESPSNVMLADWAEPIDKLRQRVSLFDRVAQKKEEEKHDNLFHPDFVDAFLSADGQTAASEKSFVVSEQRKHASQTSLATKVHLEPRSHAK